MILNKRRIFLFISAFYFLPFFSQIRSVDSLKLLLNKEQQPVLKLDLMKEIGTQLVENGFYKDALVWYFNALKIAETRKDTVSMAALCNNIAVIYTETEQNKKSYPFAEKAVQLALRRNDDKLKANAYNTLGNAYYADFQDSIALGHFSRSLEFRIRSADTNAIGAALKNLAGVYNEFGDHKKALQLTHRARIFRLMKGSADQKMSLFVTLSDLHFGIYRYDSAFYYLNKASEYLSASKNLYEIKSYYTSSIQIYRQRNDLVKVINDMNSLLRIKDSILDKESQKNMSELQTKYETEKKDLEIRARKAELHEQRQEAQISTMIFSGILVVIMLIVVFVWMRFRSKQKLKSELEKIERESLRKQTELITKEKERNRMSAELHDNVGSSVSFISTKIDWMIKHGNFQKEVQNELATLKESSQEVMSGLRETLWTLNSKVISNIDLCDKLKVYIKRHLHCSFVLKDELEEEFVIQNEDVLALYRCCQEIINNINKHSKADKVEINFSSSKNCRLRISIKDDGIGMEEMDKKESYGLRNIQNRLSQIGAEFNLESNQETGTWILINYF